MIRTKPVEHILIQNKPIAIERASYPYQLLEDRAFELLVYSLYKSEIEKGDLVRLYDDIWLMEGVKEKGKDCALFRQGIFSAVIQCKHRSKLAPVGKVEVVKEIMKFLFHIINDSEQIHQPLHYYFIVSSDFHQSSRELLQDFNRQIVLEKDIEKWAISIINENKALSKIEYKNIREALYGLLSSIVVHHKASADLTLLLNKPFNINIIDTFFTVKKVVDITSLDKATDKIISEIEKRSTERKLSAIEITEQLARSSVFLSDYNNIFFNLPDSHITRKETTDLYNWIKAPVGSTKDDDKILLLTGNAGYGQLYYVICGIVLGPKIFLYWESRQTDTPCQPSVS